MLKNRTTSKGIPLINENNLADINQVNESFHKIDELLGDKTALGNHEKRKVSDSGGVHGLRFNEEKEELEVEKQNGEWISVGSGGTSAFFDPVKDIKVKEGNGKLTVSWSDPESSIFNTWAGTKLIYKVGSYPENPNDGTLAVDNKVKDKYKDNGFNINALNNGTKYYFMFFPYDIKNKYNLNNSNRTTGTPQGYKVMTVEINKNDENSETTCTYRDDAVGMIPGSEEWDKFFGYYPCLFKNGQISEKLNKTNRMQKEDGSPADVTSGNAGDSGTIFPLRWWKIVTSGNTLRVSVTDNPNPGGDFEALAHTKGSEIKDFFFIGGYVGSVVDGKLRSLSGKVPETNIDLHSARVYANANGNGYEQWAIHQITYLQCIYLLKYKNLNSQLALGRGFVDGNTGKLNTGGTETKGMDWGESTGKQHMVFAGLEDFWGNIYQWVDGLLTDSNGNIYTATDNFSNWDSYTNQGWSGFGGSSNDIRQGYLSDVQGSTKTGFFPKTFNGSATTYYADFCDFRIDYLPVFGGSWTRASDVGVFSLRLTFSRSTRYGYVGARLMYL